MTLGDLPFHSHRFLDRPTSSTLIIEVILEKVRLSRSKILILDENGPYSLHLARYSYSQARRTVDRCPRECTAALHFERNSCRQAS